LQKQKKTRFNIDQNMKITIGSRGSDLALWQANFVKNQLEEKGHEVGIKIIVTQGDRIQDLSFDKMEGKGFFTKEIEEALLRNEIDLAVHSHKDLETKSPEGLVIAAVSYRENPADLLLIRKSSCDSSQPFQLKKNSVIGTSAARRKSQLHRLVPGCTIKDLRGNVPTRIKKLRDREFDAIVLAAAGVQRLNLDLSDLVSVELAPNVFVPAPAQGVLALQVRAVDHALRSALLAINHPDVAEEIGVERDVMRLMDGGCQLPLGVYCRRDKELLKVYASFSRSANKASEIFYLEANSADGLAQLIVGELSHAGK
jgi:hydroxymethylbilane synthase